MEIEYIRISKPKLNQDKAFIFKLSITPDHPIFIWECQGSAAEAYW